MKNFEFIDTNDEPLNLKTIKLVQYNLWMEPSPKRSDFDFWLKRFKDQKVPFCFVKFDTTLLNSMGEKMNRRVYGIFLDMKSWENYDAKL